MRPIERILCCTDLSENAAAAVHAAIRIAELHQAQLTILYVLSTSDGAQPPVLEAVRQEILKRAQEEIARMCPAGGSVAAQAEVRQGPVKETLLRAAHELKADLIVAGAFGQSKNYQAGPGRVAEYLVRKGPCSVLLVRPEYSDNFTRVAMAGDFSDYSMTVLNRAVDLALRFGAGELKLFHICHLPDEYQLTGQSQAEALKTARQYAEQHAQEFLAKADKRGMTVTPFIAEGREAPAIAALAKDHGTDLLVLGSHGRTPGGAVLLGSVAERTLRACPSSMWVEIEPARRIGVLRALGLIMGLAE